jgi:hypothetical protein
MIEKLLNYEDYRLHVAVVWLTHLPRIPEASTLIIGMGFSCFSQSLQAYTTILASERPRPLPSTSL